jgi:diguanylate cyclase (GGDEF)-like protein
MSDRFARATPLASRLYAALVALLIVSEIAAGRGVVPGTELVVAIGIVGAIALLAASVRLRSRRVKSWAIRHGDPFPLFALAAALLAGSVLAPSKAASSWPFDLDHVDLLSLAAASCAAGAFLVMIRDATPGRALDTLFLCGIVSATACLVCWLVVVRVGGTSPVRAVGVLLVPGVDLAVVGLGVVALRQRRPASPGLAVLVVSWVAVVLAHSGAFIASLRGNDLRVEVAWTLVFVALGLLGVAAFDPRTTQLPQVLLQPLRPLPSGQVTILGVAMLLGPVLVGLQLDQRDTVPAALILGGFLSVLVFVHLVRMVQGRAVVDHRAHHDDLTGLPNRTLFQERVTIALLHARRHDTGCAVLFVDLDRFKNVNDSLGHAVGNQLLVAAAQRLRSVADPAVTVARLGGDEFVVFLPHLAMGNDAARVADRVLAAFREPFSLGRHRLFISPSIGIAVSPDDGDTAETLLKAADIAMYRAKQRGRNTMCVYDRTMNDEAHERLELESQLHTAVERGELLLHYQPKVHLPTGRMTGMEALLRWDHPELGLLEPARFISVAEDTGLIVPVGEWALEEACRQNEAWRQAGFAPLIVAVNLSARQFQHQRIEDVTARILRSTGLDPALLELEVTESLAMQDPENIRSTLQDLRDMGVSCSIDDFGTGYSGLSYLTRFPIDTLKIDRSFVATIEHSDDSPIVVAVIALAHGLGLKVVAEGVETDRQLERLRELGCDEMQGFLFSRPVPPERFEQLLMLESISPDPSALTGSVQLLGSRAS